MEAERKKAIEPPPKRERQRRDVGVEKQKYPLKIGVVEAEREKATEPPPKKREAREEAERCWSRKLKVSAKNRGSLGQKEGKRSNRRQKERGSGEMLE